MKRNSMGSISRALISALLIASAALSGCATVADESFLYAGNDFAPVDKMEGA